MKKRIYDILKIGNKEDIPSRICDYFLVATILSNIICMFLETFDELIYFYSAMRVIEMITLTVFIIEYILRLWTAEFLYPNVSRGKAMLKFIISFDGIVELLTILPWVYFAGFVAFRMLRVVRIFHLFRINKYSDSFTVIKNVLLEKKNQLLSSIFIVLVLMLSASLTIYAVEHGAQPDKFKNAFSGLWWSMSTLLTVGYGDIYPITALGKAMAMIIELLGVLVVAIPTGIISAGFVEQYSKVQGHDKREDSLHHVHIDIDSNWIGKGVNEIESLENVTLVYYLRDGARCRADETYIAQVGDMVAIYKFKKNG